jgi:serine/threonine protein kinase/tetratricopeptide (TPR) repeat protein
MKCPNCGHEIIAGQKNCSYCQRDLSHSAQDVVPSFDITVISESSRQNKIIINNRFSIIKKLGKGGMGEIFLAEDIKLKRQVAIKRIPGDTLKDPVAKIRFLREAQTASQLDHINICTLYEVYEEHDDNYIVMQYINGVTLEHIIKLKKLGLSKVLDIALQICDAMTEAHAKHVIHRDIKPANIMITEKGLVKVLDFGLATFQDHSFFHDQDKGHVKLTEKGYVMGTVSYMSPEQSRGKELDQTTDIFSFGVVLYEMLYGFNPFYEKEQINTLHNVLHKEIEFTDPLPEQLKIILKKILHKEKKHRYQSFLEIKKELENFKTAFFGISGNQEDRSTDIIDFSEQQRLLRQSFRSSDNQNLGDIVKGIKQNNASTKPITVTSGRKSAKILSIMMITVLLLTVVYYFYKQGLIPFSQKKIPVLFLETFTNSTSHKELSAQIHFLLTASLDQFTEFKIIDRPWLESVFGPDISDKKKLIAAAKQAIGESYELIACIEGDISQKSDFINLTVSIQEIKGNLCQHASPMVIHGSHDQLDSILKYQIDKIIERTYYRVFPNQTAKELKIKPVSAFCGSHWQPFSDFYHGYQWFLKLESQTENYLQKSRELPIAGMVLAEWYVFRGQLELAAVAMKSVINNLENLPLPMQLKVKSIQAGLEFKSDQQIGFLKKRQQYLPFSKYATFDLAEAYFQQGQANEAKNYFMQVIELDSRFALAYNHVGYCYSHLGDHIKALEAFEKYKSLDGTPNSSDSLGDGYFFYGDLTSAESCKNWALSNDEEGTNWAYLTLADIYVLKHEYHKALDYLKRYAIFNLDRKEQVQAALLNTQGFIELLDQRAGQAVKTIEKSLAVFDPQSQDLLLNNAQAHWLLGMAAAAQKDLAKCQEQANWLRKLCENNRLSWRQYAAPYKFYLHLQAWLLELQGKTDAAETIYREMLENRSQLSFQITYFHYQFFHNEYVSFLIRQKQFKKALAETDECLKFNFRYIPALWNKAYILEQIGQPALEIYKKIADLIGPSTEENYHRILLQGKLSR